MEVGRKIAEKLGVELVSIDVLSQCVERLVAAIGEALDEMRESGELAELSTRYFGQDITQDQSSNESVKR